MDFISFDNVVLLHDNTTSDIGLVATARLEVITPPRSLNLGAFWNVCFVNPIVDVMIIHVFELCQSASDHFLRIRQLASPVTVQIRFRFNVASPTHLGCLCQAAACDQCCRVGRAGRHSVLTWCFMNRKLPIRRVIFIQQQLSSKAPDSFARTLITTFQRSRAAERFSSLHPYFVSTGT